MAAGLADDERASLDAVLAAAHVSLEDVDVVPFEDFTLPPGVLRGRQEEGSRLVAAAERAGTEPRVHHEMPVGAADALLRPAVGVEGGRVVALRLVGGDSPVAIAATRLGHLLWLEIHRVPVETLEGVSFHKLEGLWIIGGHLRSVGSLSAPSLRLLNLAQNQLESFVLSPFPTLRQLDVSWNRLHGLGAVGASRDLVALSVAGNPIPSLEGLEGFPSLRHFDASHCQLTSMAPVSSLKKAIAVELWGNQIRRADGVDDLPGLFYLGLGDNPFDYGDPANVERWHRLGRGRMFSLR